MISLTTVHTTGVNWVSVSTIVGAVAAVVGLSGNYVGKKIDAHRKQTLGHIETIAKALTGRLDRFDDHLHTQDARLQSVSERMARLEGPVRQIDSAVPSIKENVESLVKRKNMDPDA